MLRLPGSDPGACVISPRYLEDDIKGARQVLADGSVDVLVNKNPYDSSEDQDELRIPGDDTTASGNDIKSNVCQLNQMSVLNDSDFGICSTMVQEAGHALGL